MRETQSSFWAPTSLLVAGMFILLAAQLTWWIIFFRLNQDYVVNLEQALDRYKIQTAKKGALEPGIICTPDRSKCEIDPAAVQARDAVRRRQMLMLISETCFVLGVVGYGSFRVIRSVQREKQLSLERITFLNSVTHELKTPVAGALLTLQTLLKRKLKDSEKKELLEDGIENLKRLTSQIENLLLAGQVGRLQRFEKHQASDVVKEIQAHVQRSASSIARAKAKIALNLPDSALAQIPDSLLERILDALLQNALAYSGGSPVIWIEVETEPRHVLIRVRDSGEGIPQSEQENVFAPFYRLRNAQGRGTGLGLYLVRQIVQGNGGTVQINPARNSEFMVRLRRAQ